MSAEEVAIALKSYLRSLDKEQLDDALKEVLEELRRRDSEIIKKDFLTQSQSLLARPPEIRS